MDYEKLYREALERASKLRVQNPFDTVSQMMERVFPELKESEDEKIRNQIINFIEEYGSPIHCEWQKDWIAWLEKQGEKKSVEEYNGEDFGIDSLYHAQRILEKTLGEVEGYQSDDGILEHKCAISAVKKLYRQESNWSEMDEDKRIRKNCIHFLDLQKSHHASTIEIDECIDWLEKQDEQNPTNKIEPKFKVKYACGEYNVVEEKEINGVTFYGIEDEPNHIDYVLPDDCEIISGYDIKENGSPYPTKPAVFSEQKPTDNVESKFKVGDWIASSVLGTAHIIGVNDYDEYQLEYTDGYQTFSSIDYVNYEYDKWTIEDAKDGDVLTVNGRPFIYCCNGDYQGNVTPATKEQRDTFFAKMREAGYEWDAEKKEPKKIETKGGDE